MRDIMKSALDGFGRDRAGGAEGDETLRHTGPNPEAPLESRNGTDEAIPRRRERENLSGSGTEGKTAACVCRAAPCIFYKEGKNVERKTPLYDAHVALGGKIVPFAGYLLPVEYPTGVIAEHRAVRAQAGLFDVSHMGEAVLKGADALANLNRLLTNDFTGMKDGQARYSPMCGENGGTVDDLLVYKFGEGNYMLVLNAANREKDVKWISEQLSGDVSFEDISDDVAQVALQGPAAEEILRAARPDWALPKRNYRFKPQADALVSRTGYTGEDGFEIYLKPEKAAELWNALLEAGKPFGLIPCGLGARDTLRMEAAMPLYGHELSADITPLEAGLDVFVKLDKPDFIGRQGMLNKGARVRRCGLVPIDRGIPREGAQVLSGDEAIGRVTSGTHLPTLGHAACMALIKTEYTQPDTEVLIDVRGRRLRARVVPLPFYKRGTNA